MRVRAPLILGNSLVALLVYSSAIAASQFKRKCFSTEHEVRLIVANHIEWALASKVLPWENSGDSQHLCIDLRNSATGHMPIKSVRIGPNANFDSALEVAQSAIDNSPHVGAVEIVRQEANELR